MSLLDQGQPADTTQRKRHRGLLAGVAVLAVALLASGAWLFADAQQPSVEEQQAAIMEVVTAHNDAINAHDGDALEATITDDFIWTYGDDPDLVYGIGPSYYINLSTRWGGDLRETFTGDPVFLGEFQVAIPTHRDPQGGRKLRADGSPEPLDGTYTFTLREVDGQLKIATMVFTITEP